MTSLLKKKDDEIKALKEKLKEGGNQSGGGDNASVVDTTYLI